MTLPEPRNAGRRTRALALAAGLLLAGGRADAADAPAVRTLVFFGDSLTAGLGLPDPDTQSYPALVQKKIDAERLPWRVVNAGLSGETSAGGLRRVDWVLHQKIDLFVLELGGNDGLRGTPLAATESNLQGIIERVRAKYPSAGIIIAGMRMPGNLGPEYTEGFGAIYPELARKNRLPLIPFLLDGVAGRQDLNQADGIHPTPAGEIVIADDVWKAIRPMLLEKG